MENERTRFCQTCFFFEFYEKQHSLSLVEGHCKILELINNTWAKCSGIEGCRGSSDLHTSKSELTEEEKKYLNNFYLVRTNLLNDLKIAIGNQIDIMDLDDLGAIDAGEMNIQNIRDKLGVISLQGKKYFYDVKGIKQKSRRLVNRTF